MRLLSTFISLFVALGAFAAPNKRILEKRQIQTLSSADIAAFKPYSFYTAAAHCVPSTLETWTCGTNCKATSGFIPIAAGGNGATVQYWYVGYDPSLATIIVGRQGTEADKILPLLTDIDIILVNLDSSLFPGVNSNVKVHAGFGEAHKLAAPDVLAAVNTARTKFGTNTITTVGHSLGAAISLLEAIHLKLTFPESTVRFYGYGSPRVGNQQFADLADSELNTLHRINNREDLIPILPGRFLGYRHPSGEDHIGDDGSWSVCPGQENTSGRCTDGDVPSVFSGNSSDHNGPYDGVIMRC